MDSKAAADPQPRTFDLPRSPRLSACFHARNAWMNIATKRTNPTIPNSIPTCRNSLNAKKVSPANIFVS